MDKVMDSRAKAALLEKAGHTGEESLKHREPVPLWERRGGLSSAVSRPGVLGPQTPRGLG